MPSRERTRDKASKLLRKLRSAGFKLVFEVGEESCTRGVRVALRGQDVYVAALNPEKGGGLNYTFNQVCRKKDSPGIKAMSAGSNPTVALDDETYYSVYRAYPHFVPEDVFNMLKRGHEFSDEYMKKLNEGC